MLQKTNKRRTLRRNNKRNCIKMNQIKLPLKIKKQTNDELGQVENVETVETVETVYHDW